MTPSLRPATLAAADEAATLLSGFLSEFTADDAAFAPVFDLAEGAASAELAGFTADAREIGLARLGLAASEDARNAASIGLVRVAAPPPPTEGNPVVLAAMAEAADPVEQRALARSVLGAGGVVVPLSAGLVTVRAAGAFAVDADERVATVCAAVTAAVENARELATALAIAQDDWQHAMVGVRSHASSRQLAGLAFATPVIDARFAVPALGVTLAAAYTAIETLVDRGILVSRGPERRNRAWFAPAVVDALDAFASRARR